MALRVHQRPTDTVVHPNGSVALLPARTFAQVPPPIELKMAVSESKIKSWLMSEDQKEGMRIFNIYKGHEPGLLSVQRPNKSNQGHGNIPSGLVSADLIKASIHPSKTDDLTSEPVEVKKLPSPQQKFSKGSVERYFKSPLIKINNKDDKPKPRIFCLTNYRFVENQGEIELHQYFEPLTKESYCNQPWIEKHKRKWVTVDQDLVIHRADKKEVSGKEEKFGGYSIVLFTKHKRIPQKKVELVAEQNLAEPKSCEYLLMRIVYFIIAIAKEFFAFFLKNRFSLDEKESKESQAKSGVLMLSDEKESKISGSKSGILMASNEEKVRTYFAKPSRPLPLFPELRKKIEDKINSCRKLAPELTTTSTPTHAEAPSPIQVEVSININLEASDADQDEYLAF